MSRNKIINYHVIYTVQLSYGKTFRNSKGFNSYAEALKYKQWMEAKNERTGTKMYSNIKIK